MSMKMNLIRQILSYEKEKKRLTNKKKQRIEDIYKSLSINDTARNAPQNIAKFVMRDLENNEITIENTSCLHLKIRENRKYFANTALQKDIAIFYIHGGGFCSGFAQQGIYLIKVLMKFFGCECIAPKYPLSPENVFPKALDTLENVYLKIKKQYKHIILLGESAGSNLAVSLMSILKSKRKPLPTCAILPSGFYDLTRRCFCHKENEKTDVSLSNKQLKYMGLMYAFGENITPDIDYGILQNPLISPVYASMKGFPPLFFSVCRDEILYDDTLQIVKNCKKDNIQYVLLESEKCFHAYGIMGDFFPESSKVTKEILKFIINYTELKISYFKCGTKKKA